MLKRPSSGDLSFIPSTHVRRLTMVCNSSFWEPTSSTGFYRQLCIYVHRKQNIIPLQHSAACSRGCILSSLGGPPVVRHRKYLPGGALRNQSCLVPQPSSLRISHLLNPHASENDADADTKRIEHCWSKAWHGSAPNLTASFLPAMVT